MERTLILLKPDCMERRLAGTVLARFEQKGFQIVGMKLMQVTPELAAKHYAEHVEAVLPGTFGLHHERPDRGGLP